MYATELNRKYHIISGCGGSLAKFLLERSISCLLRLNFPFVSPHHPTPLLEAEAHISEARLRRDERMGDSTTPTEEPKHVHKPHVQHSIDTFQDGLKRATLVAVIGAVIGAVEFGTTSILAEMIYNKFSLIQDLVDDDQSQWKVCGV